MGLISRNKGKAFERLIVKAFGKVGVKALRSFGQARSGGETPDVIVPYLWVECGHGNTMDGRKKLDQAMTDEDILYHEPHEHKMPVAIVRKTGSRDIEAWLLAGDLMKLLERKRNVSVESLVPVCVGLADFLDLYVAWKKEIEK